MTRTEALKAVIASLQNELAALKSFDIEALAAATAEKEGRIGVLAARNDNPVSTEERALAEEAMRLNETARAYVNLMSANVKQRLEALTGIRPVAYAPTRAVA
ncbi:flagellar protein FlgN [Sphingomonas tabacisoli]|uniref:Flagellar protein FlgN n=1 Tax=Sphingomonas tabacisoli TaxID=2249466 RepID=A0ABW4HX96_9SPHN